MWIGSLPNSFSDISKQRELQISKYFFQYNYTETVHFLVSWEVAQAIIANWCLGLSWADTFSSTPFLSCSSPSAYTSSTCFSWFPCLLRVAASLETKPCTWLFVSQSFLSNIREPSGFLDVLTVCSHFSGICFVASSLSELEPRG